MPRENFNDLQAFVLVAREGSFTKAASQLGVSQSALSHSIRGLEERMGIRLLARSTRSVAPTEIGERLLLTLAPRFEEIEHQLATLSKNKDKPAGTIRINATEYAATHLIWPKVLPLLQDYPQIKIEITVDYSFTDIVANRFDLGVRLTDTIPKDMISVPISAPVRMAVVASPDYFKRLPHPQVPADLKEHNCIALRLPTYGGLYAWEFEKNQQEVVLRVEGQLVFNSSSPMLRAALAGAGMAYIPEDMVLGYIAEGKLIRVLEDWCPYFPGFCLYYPNRRQSSVAFSLVVDTLKYRP